MHFPEFLEKSPFSQTLLAQPGSQKAMFEGGEPQQPAWDPQRLGAQPQRLAGGVAKRAWLWNQMLGGLRVPCLSMTIAHLGASHFTSSSLSFVIYKYLPCRVVARVKRDQW